VGDHIRARLITGQGALVPTLRARQFAVCPIRGGREKLGCGYFTSYGRDVGTHELRIVWMQCGEFAHVGS
jgi:hypothetical protein